MTAAARIFAFLLGFALRRLLTCDPPRRFKSLKLADASMIAVSKACRNLRTLEVGHQSNITDLGLIAVLKANKKLTTFHTVGSKRLTNKTVFVLSRKNLLLTDLNLSHCRQITSDGLKTLNSLRSLTSINLSGVFLLSDSAIRLLPPNSLKYINLSGIPKLTDAGVAKLAEKFLHLERVNLSGNERLTVKSAELMLKHCLRLNHLDMSHVFETPPSSPTLAQVIDENPHHKFMTVDSDKCIFDIEKTVRLHLKRELEHVRYKFRLTHSSKVVQSGWRRLVQHRVETSALRARNRWRIKIATKIQSQVRRMLATSYVQRVRAAKEKVAVMLQARYVFLHLLKLNVMANKHWCKTIMKNHFKHLLVNLAIEREIKRQERERQLYQQAIIHHEQSLQRSVLRAWRVMQAKLKHDRHKEGFADAHWGKIILPDLMRTWKRKTKLRVARRRKLAEAFMFIVHISFDNSTPQMTRRTLASDFYRVNLLCLAWLGFRKFFEECSETLRKAKIAADHCRANFKKRALTVVFKALRGYAYDRIFKRVAKRKGVAWFIKRSKREAFKIVRKNAIVTIQYRKDIAKAVALFQGAIVSTSFRQMNLYKKHRKQMKSRKIKGQAHFDHRTTCVHVAQWIDWTINKVDMKRKTKTARSHYYSKTTRKLFVSWKVYTKHSGNVKAMAAAKQASILLGKTFSAWKRYWKDASAAKRMAEEIAKQNEENRELIYNSATDIARLFRGWKGRQETVNYRAFRDWAVLKCQNQFRVWSAKRVLLKKLRWFYLQQNLVEEKVEEQMAAEEAYMRWWMMMEQHAITIKRILLGHRGRVLAYARRQQRFREQGLKFQEKKKADLKFFNDQVKLRERLKTLRKEASITIQKVYRGLLGRRRYEDILQQKKEREIASKVQAAFRGKQGRRRWNARKRHLENMARITESRRIQASGLRRIGFKQRRTQRTAIRVLRSVGLESMGFTQKWSQQFGELKVDAMDTYQEFYRFFKSWRLGGFDSYLRDKEKRRMLAEYETDITPTIASAVRIMERRHKYTGLTGQVVTIDRSFPTKAIAEVRMDVDGKIIYYQMITEPTMYDPPQPSMYRIPFEGKKGIEYDVVVRCREHLLRWAEEEKIKRREGLAARKIQSMARGYMSKVRVAKMRYRDWSRLRNKREAVLQTLNIYNAVSLQSARIMLTMGFTTQRNVPILYEVPDFPPRIEEAITMRTLRRMLNDEFATKLDRRIAFCEVHEARLAEGTYQRRVRKFSPFRVNLASGVSELKKNTTSLIAQKVHDHGSQGGFVEKLALFFGGTEWRRTNSERHSWMKRVSLEQFEQSPHVRMSGLCIYHGVFKGIVGSKAKPFVPHGEGVADFMQGFGVGREEKTLHISILQARDLRAADFNNSDPFAVIECNRKKIKTKTIMMSLDPVWNETFAIDITDPYHIIKVVVYDWDKWSSNDFLGQIVFPISTLADGKKVKKWYKLIGKDKGTRSNDKKSKREIEDENDLGEIEIEMYWTQKEDSDDIDRRRLQHKKAIIIQCWMRQVASMQVVKKRQASVQNQIKVLGDSSTMIQCAYRCMRAKKILKAMRVHKKAMTRIQCASRQWIARRKARYERNRYFAARSIQCCLRKYMSLLRREELARILGLLEDECAAAIQRVARLGVARAMIQKQRAKMKEKEGYMDKRKNLETFHDWIKTYGYDPTYGSRRLRRICLKVFARVLSLKRSTVVTPYGEAGVEQFPAPYLETREGDDFIIVNLYSHTKLSLPKTERVKLRESSPKYWTSLKLSQVSIIETVNLRIIDIQCLFRVALSNVRCGEKRRTRKAAIMVQRKFRWRYRVKAKLSLGVQCLWRRYLAMEELKFKKIEVIKAMKIQGAFRCYLGRKEMEEKRRVRSCEILDSSGDLNEIFDASRVLDGKADTFWCSGAEEVSSQWLTFDLGKKHDIGKVKLYVPDNTAAPKEVSVECSHRTLGPWKHVESIRLKQGGDRWQSFSIPKTVSRFWKIAIRKNYGNQQAVSIVGVGFFLAKEITAFVTEQPRSLMVSPGPPVGRSGGEIVLKCNADGWPPPKFQWTKNGVDIEGENSETLTIKVGSKKRKQLKRFRCIHCKKINVELPMNLYRVICNNCKTPFDFPEVEEAVDLRKPLELETNEVELQLKQLRNNKADLIDDMKSLKNRLKRETFAKERGEEILEDVGEAENGEANAGKVLEQPSLLESIGAATNPSGVDTSKIGSSLAEGSSVIEKRKAFNYKQMMTEFTKLEEPLGFSDDDLSSAGNSAAPSLGVESKVATAADSAKAGAAHVPLEIGTVVVPAVTGGGAGQVSPLAKGAKPSTLSNEEEQQKRKEGNDNSDDDEGQNDAPQNEDDDDLSIGHIIDQFMERIGEEEEAKESETERKIAELEIEIKECEEKIEKMEKKSWWLLRKRLAASEYDPCKVNYDGEGVYVCVVSNIRGGEILRHNKTRAAIIFVDDPVPSVIKVTEEYHLRTRLRRRNWPKYLSLYGWFVEGKVCGDVIVRYNEGSIYDGPYMDERWLDYMGQTVKSAFESDHWGVWVTPEDVVYEGPTVDNHFDVTNIQGEFRVTYANGEVFEGEYVDERRHGIGEYHYLDGSVYEGEFFKDRRQGFGIFTRTDGSIYEGEWDRDYIHGEGIWRWSDGSTYMGDNIDGKRTGRGVYITSHGDVYVGEFKGNSIHGEGTFTYNDGTRYEGQFRENLREGDAVFTYPNGVRDIGTWLNDKREGEFVVRRPVYADESDTVKGVDWDDEVQHGIYEEGEFVDWLAPPVNPKATSEFIRLFEQNDEEFDGVYAMLIARKLPLVPHGIQETHPKVEVILKRIAREGGQLVAYDTYQDTKDKIKEVEPILEDAKREYRDLRKNEDHVDTVIAGIEREVGEVERKIAALEAQETAFAAAIESFWLEDHEDTREIFVQKSKELEKLERSEWFQIRHYHEPPALIENVMVAVCMLMMEPDTWKGAQALLGSSQQNRDDGDTEAVWQEYEVKMLHMLKTFDVFKRASDPSLLAYVGHFLVDPRFKSDNYFLQSHGPAAVKLVEWIWSCYAYVKKSKEIMGKSDARLSVKAAIGRFKQGKEVLLEKAENYETRASGFRERVAKSGRRKDRWQAKYDKLEMLLMKCQEMVVQYTSDDERELDDYERMLAEEGEIKGVVETVVELLTEEVEAENENPDLEELGLEEDGRTLHSLIDKAVSSGRRKMFRLGDYKYSGGRLVVGERPVDVRQIRGALVADVVEQVNFVLNEFPSTTRWTMLDGTVIKAGLIEDVIRNRWSKLDEKEAIDAAEKTWETIFPKNKHTAFQAVQARTNFIMAESAKQEARIWRERHREEVSWIENWMASEFAEDYHEETARVALEMREDKRVGVDKMAMADVWCRLNRPLVLKELDRQNAEQARKFQDKHPDDTAKSALMFRNMKGDEGFDSEDVEEALAWISLNLAAIVEAEDAEGARLSLEFEEKCGALIAKAEAELEVQGPEGKAGDNADAGAGSDGTSAREGKGAGDDEEKKAASEDADSDNMAKKVVDAKQVIAREAVRLKMDKLAPKEERELALAWGAREENKDSYHLMQNQINKELLHEDLVRGSNMKGILEDIETWYHSLELRRQRLGLKTDKQRAEEEEAKAKERERLRIERERVLQEEERERKKEEELEREKEKERKKKPGAGLLPKAKKKKSPTKKTHKDQRKDVKEEEEEKEPEVTDEGILKLCADIAKARKKFLQMAMKRIEYNAKRLAMFEERQEEILRDKTYLEVPDAIRPSEAKLELQKQKTLREDRLKFLIGAIATEKQLLEKTELEIKEQKERIFIETGEEYVDATSGEGDDDWEQYFDETYGAWCYYNKKSGEVQWA